MLAIRTPCGAFRRQQTSNLFPARRRQRRQLSNGQGSGQVKRRIWQGDCGELPRAAAAMRLLCVPLVLAAPPRPVQMQGTLGSIFLPHQLEKPNLRDTGAHAPYAPFFAVALRAATKAA